MTEPDPWIKFARERLADRAAVADDPLAPLLPNRTVNDLDAIQALPFSMLSGPEAGEAIRDSLIAEIKALRANVRASVPTLSDEDKRQLAVAEGALEAAAMRFAEGGDETWASLCRAAIRSRFPDLGDQ